MTKLYKILLLCFLVQLTELSWLSAQTPDVSWVQKATGAGVTNSKTGRDVAYDAQGNAYMTGSFDGTITFENTTLTSSGAGDIFIAKYNAAGALQWAHRAGGAGADGASALTVDGAGNAYIIGQTTGTAAFGNFSVTGIGALDIFIAKYDTEGAVQWVRQVGGTGSDTGSDIVLDGAGNILVTGSFVGTFTVANSTLTSTGNTWPDIFIAKFDATGNDLWAQQAGSANEDRGFGIAVDGAGNAYITGFFRETATFGSITLTSLGFSDIFLARYDGGGTLQWAKRTGGTSMDYGFNVAADAYGNVYLTGQMSGFVFLENNIVVPNSGPGIFVAKYDGDGEILWAQGAGGLSGYGSTIALDNAGNVYVSGNFMGTATFGGSTITSSGMNSDIFYARYDASGVAQWAQRAGGTGADTGYGIAVDGAGNAALVGVFQNSISFGSAGNTGSAGYNIFIARLDASGAVQWVKTGTGTGAAALDFARSIAVDGAGNSYVTGYFQGTITIGLTTLESLGYFDIFVAKFDANGNPLWAQQAGNSSLQGTAGDYGYGIAVDRAGNAYVTGQFSGAATFGPISITSDRNADVFLAKYDTNGNIQWVKRAGGTSQDNGYGVALDAAGNAFVTGRFNGTATFGEFMLTSNGNYDVFIAKYDAAGNVLWARHGGSTTSDLGNAVTTDAAGNAYITGNLLGAATFGTTTLNPEGGSAVFVARYSPVGDLIWAKAAKGTGGIAGYGIATDVAGNALVTGNFFVSINFDNTELTSTGSSDVFIAKYDAAGNVLWAQKAGGTGSDFGYGLVADGAGNSLITGYFSGTATFGNETLTSTGNTDIFFAGYDANGNPGWAFSAGGASSDTGYGIALDERGNAYGTGTINATARFGSLSLAASGIEVYVLKLANAATPVSAARTIAQAALTLYPNPVNDKLQLVLPLQVKANLELRLLDANGRLLLKQNHTAVSGEFHHLLDLKDKASGVYLLQLVTDQEVITRKIVKQ